MLTLLVGVVTLGTGKTALLQGIVHLVILAAFLFLAVVPWWLGWEKAALRFDLTCKICTKTSCLNWAGTVTGELALISICSPTAFAQQTKVGVLSCLYVGENSVVIG